MVITVGASPRAGVWLGWHMPIRYSWKQMLPGSQAHWLKRLWKGRKSKWISQRIALFDPTVQRFSCHRRGEVDCGRRTSRRRKDTGRDRRGKKCVLCQTLSLTPNLFSFSSCAKMPPLAWADGTESYLVDCKVNLLKRTRRHSNGLSQAKQTDLRNREGRGGSDGRGNYRVPCQC